MVFIYIKSKMSAACRNSQIPVSARASWVSGRGIVTVICLGLIQSISLTLASSARRYRVVDLCEPIDIAMCAGMPYNMTRMPNHLHHSTQENARLAIGPYSELLKQNCSHELLFFLCAMFAPICTPRFQKDAIPPCRSVCENARAGCEPVMNAHNFSWPEDLNCDRLPEYDKGVCVSPEAIVSSMPEDTKGHVIEKPKTRKPDCSCKARNKPSKRKYRKGKFDYAIAADVIRIVNVDAGNSVVQIKVTKVLKHNKVMILENRDTELWANSSCVCPDVLRRDREYLIVGYEDVVLNRLLILESSLITRWNSKWENKLQTWSKRKSRQRRCKNRKCRKSRQRSGKRRRKLRCEVLESGESRKRIKCYRTTKRDRTSSQMNNSLKRKQIRSEQTDKQMPNISGNEAGTVS